MKHVPVIAITANARNEQVQQAMEAGMVNLPRSTSFESCNRMNYVPVRCAIQLITYTTGRCTPQTLPNNTTHAENRSTIGIA